MMQTPSKEFLGHLCNVQLKFNAPKSRYNSFGDYHYRSAEDMEAGLKPLLAEEGLTMVIQDEIVHIEGRFYIKATVTVTDGESLVHGIGYAREVESKTKSDPAQITGMASSYARKYALGGLFLVDDQADPDSQDNGREQAPTKKAPAAHQKPQGHKAALWAALGRDKALSEALMGAEHPDTDEFYSAALGAWKAIEKYAAAHNGEARALAEGSRKRSDYQATAEWYTALAAEFNNA